MERQTTIKLIPFHPKHVEVMDVRDSELHSILSLEDSNERLEAVRENETLVGTFLCDGRVLCCAGYRILWPGVAEVWILPSRHVSKVAIRFSKIIRRQLDGIIERHNIHRLQTISIDDDLHNRWMRFIGFSDAGLMRQYTHDKQDYRMWERIIEWEP